jgi:hypothetical protein
MDFPYEITFGDDGAKGVMRLKVAAICACLDYEMDGGHYSEEEVQPFFQTIKKTDINGKEYESQIDPHAFLYIQPSGDLADDVDTIVNALCISIDKGQLTPAFLKIGLDGVIDPIGTWISTNDFYKWATSRGFQHDDVCNKYDNGEGHIFDHAMNNANDARKEFEAPYFHAEYRNLADGPNIIIENLKAECEKLFLENMIMRQGFAPQEKPEDPPLRTRERNTLLSIIAILCGEAKYDYTRPAKVASLIKKKAEEMGLTIGESTIESHLKRIPDALEVRMS